MASLNNDCSEGTSSGSTSSGSACSGSGKCKGEIGDVGQSDHLRRLIIIPDGTDGFYPSIQAMHEVMESIKPFCHDSWKKWGEIPCHVRLQMFNYFRRRCIWHPEHDAQISSNFEKIAADRIFETLGMKKQELKKKCEANKLRLKIQELEAARVTDRLEADQLQYQVKLLVMNDKKRPRRTR